MASCKYVRGFVFALGPWGEEKKEGGALIKYGGKQKGSAAEELDEV